MYHIPMHSTGEVPTQVGINNNYTNEMIKGGRRQAGTQPVTGKVGWTDRSMARWIYINGWIFQFQFLPNGKRNVSLASRRQVISLSIKIVLV